MCSRLNCRFVHLMESDKVEVCDQRVAVCRDHANGQCKRKQCKYYHIPIVLPPANVMATIFKTQQPQSINTYIINNNNNNINNKNSSTNNNNTNSNNNSTPNQNYHNRNNNNIDATLLMLPSSSLSQQATSTATTAPAIATTTTTKAAVPTELTVPSATPLTNLFINNLQHPNINSNFDSIVNNKTNINLIRNNIISSAAGSSDNLFFLNTTLSNNNNDNGNSNFITISAPSALTTAPSTVAAICNSNVHIVDSAQTSAPNNSSMYLL